jgi:protein SCO1/2/putative membrane protein
MCRRTPLLAARALVGFACLTACAACQRLGDDLGPVPDFSLTERSGRTVTQSDLLGKVWIASFVFTRCTGPCPQVSATMAQLQSEFAGRPDVVLVTFTVDPGHDDPGELRRYAEHFGADPQRWLFLTGKEEDVYRLVNKGFLVYAEPNRGEARTAGAEVMHDPRLVVVDRRGHLRGYFQGVRDTRWPDPEPEFQDNLRRLRRTVTALTREGHAGAAVDFPRLNATLNAVSAALLLVGYTAIRRRLVRCHVACMLGALVVSAVFLASYLYFHLVVKGGEATRFQDQAVGAPDWLRHVYLAILGSHTVLAVLAAPLALYTAYQGLRGRLGRHVRVARWTLPIWLYVSVTGVVVYWMLYRLYPSP